jgi:PAS domain S-box-containing protein
MKPNAPNNRRPTESMALCGLGLAAVYWIVDALVECLSSPETGFVEGLLGPDLEALWSRAFALCLLVLFGAYAQIVIGRRRGADRRLRESETKYRTIIENMDDGYFEVDLQGRFTFVNPSLCRMAGLARGEILGRKSQEFASRATAARMAHVFNQIHLTGEPQRIGGYDIHRPDGGRLVLELSAALLRDGEGRPVGFGGVARDVSERVRSEGEKRRLETQLQQAQKMEAIGTLASGIAHDFNNIMMGILGNTSLMLAKIDSAAPHHQKLKNIEKYIESGSELTKQLLGFARGGKYMVRSTQLRELVANSARMFGRTRKEIHIHTEHLAEARPVEVDRGQIEQVLLNLFVNAWQAMPEGGDIYLSTTDARLDNDGSLPFRVEPGPYVRLSIMDTGVGMDPAILKRVFEPFFTTKEMGRGTGLGLASVYGIVKNHGGYITVSSEPGKGSTFDLYLPVSEKAPLPQDRRSGPAEKGSETVLLVDDEQITLEVGEEILRELGYSVLTARSGRTAVDLFRENADRIDLVILDMIMPDMSGGRTFDALRSIDPGVKVLLASGYSLTGEASIILERGCNDFIQKPFNMTQLSDKIRSVLSS